MYRAALAKELERQGHAIERSAENFRVSPIPRSVERAFSKRREAIEAAATVHGYRTPKGMEQAALRTREAKRSVSRDALFDQWRIEARDLGFELKRDQVRQSNSPLKERSSAMSSVRTPTGAPPDRSIAGTENAVSQLAKVTRTLDQKSQMAGVAFDLRQRERDLGRG